MKPKKELPRCRFAGVSSHIWAVQCPHPAKGDRVIVHATGETLPACGVHLRSRYAYEYRPREGSRYESPVIETVPKW